MKSALSFAEGRSFLLLRNEPESNMTEAGNIPARTPSGRLKFAWRRLVTYSERQWLRCLLLVLFGASVHVPALQGPLLWDDLLSGARQSVYQESALDPRSVPPLPLPRYLRRPLPAGPDHLVCLRLPDLEHRCVRLPSLQCTLAHWKRHPPLSAVTKAAPINRPALPGGECWAPHEINVEPPYQPPHS